MTEVVVVRHAQSSWNAVGRWQGWADPPLSDLGERQARAAAQLLRDRPFAPRGLASSDLQRAARTAELLREGLLADDAAPRPPPVRIDPGLREYDAGEWTGLRRDEIADRWPGQLEDWAAGRLAGPPGGEDDDRFAARLWHALHRVQSSFPRGPVLVVSHGRAIHRLATGLGAPHARIDHLSGWHLHLDPATGAELVEPVSFLDRTLEACVPGTPSDGEPAPGAASPGSDGVVTPER